MGKKKADKTQTRHDRPHYRLSEFRKGSRGGAGACWRCPSCGAVNFADAARCRHCGR